MNIFRFLYEGIRMAINALLSNKMRTFLTMLGVATGIFAISAILTMVNSMKYTLTENLSALGNTTLFVHNWPWKDNDDDWFKFFNRPKVSYSDFTKLKNNLHNVTGVCFQISARGQTLKAGGNSTTGAEVIGVTMDYASLTGMKFSQGRYFSEIEMQSGAAVCIIGANIASSLFPTQSNYIGQTLTMRGNKIKVIGVMEKKGTSMFGGSEDDRIMINYLFAAKNYNLSNRGIDKLIIVKAKEYRQLDYVESEIIGLVRANRGLKPTVEDNFSINKQEMLMRQINSIFQYLELGGLVITGFSLLIGGFSIFNIMYISVKERTNEIGVQKALGATRGFILYQFLTESIVTCVLGGILGLIILFIGVEIARKMLEDKGMNMHIIVELIDVIRAIGLSVFIGLIAGFIPAWIAGRLDPVVAIRAS